MDMTLFPTKGNLIIAKNTLALSKQGYELLDKKRNILVREMMALVERVKSLQTEILTTFADAYAALQTANVTMGISDVDQLSFGVPEETSIVIREHSVMGVEIPKVSVDAQPIMPTYGLVRTNLALDVAREKFVKVKLLSTEIAEIENSIYRLATSIRKTQKRANALKNIMIPKYEEITSYIVNALEEKDREEFSRLKVIKATKTKKDVADKKKKRLKEQESQQEVG